MGAGPALAFSGVLNTIFRAGEDRIRPRENETNKNK